MDGTAAACSGKSVYRGKAILRLPSQTASFTFAAPAAAMDGQCTGCLASRMIMPVCYQAAVGRLLNGALKNGVAYAEAPLFVSE